MRELRKMTVFYFCKVLLHFIKANLTTKKRDNSRDGFFYLHNSNRNWLKFWNFLFLLDNNPIRNCTLISFWQLKNISWYYFQQKGNELKLTLSFQYSSTGANFRVWEAFVSNRNITIGNHLYWFYDGNFGWNTAKWAESCKWACLPAVNVASSSSYTDAARFYTAIQSPVKMIRNHVNDRKSIDWFWMRKPKAKTKSLFQSKVKRKWKFRVDHQLSVYERKQREKISL